MHRCLPLLFLAACGPIAQLDLELVQSEVIPTVFSATLDGEASGLEAVWIEYGLDGAYDLRAPIDHEAALPWGVELLGMKPGQDYQARTAVQIDGEVHTGSAHTITTGMVPAAYPDLSLERGEGESFAGYLVTSVVGHPASPVILDQDGDYVWWYESGVETAGRSVLSRDGGAMLSLELNSNGDQAGALYRIALDGSAVESTPLDWAHHDFYEHQDGRVAYLAHDPLEIDGVDVTGDRIMELLPDGSTQEIWSCWDSEDQIPYDAGQGGPRGEWPHANALEYLPEEDAYLVSFLYLDAIARIDRATGTVDWVMGGEHSEFELVDGGTDIFERTHGMHWLEDSLLVFVNGDAQGGVSRPLELSVDEEAMLVEPRWEYWSDPSMSCVSLGDVARLDSGDTLVTYSYSGQLQQVSPAGEPVWSLSASAGGVIGYTTPVADLYDP
jgi:hypothetical protein